MRRLAPFVLVGLVVTLPTPTFAAGRLAGADRTALSRADQVLNAEEAAGELIVEAVFQPQRLSPERQQGTLAVRVDLTPRPPANPGPADEIPRFRLSFVLEDRAGETLVRHDQLDAAGPVEAPDWSLDAVLDLPAELRDVVLIVEEVATGRWGGAVVDITDEPAELGRGAAFSIRPGVWVLDGGASAPAPWNGPSGGGSGHAHGAPAPTAGEAPPAPEPPPLVEGPSATLRLLPPRGRLTGEVTFEPLLGDVAVTKVVYQVDGVTAATATKEPFRGRVRLKGPGQRQTVTAIAYAQGDSRIGQDSLVVNDPGTGFRVKLTEAGAKSASGDLAVQAQASVPADARLDRVEIYAGSDLVNKGPGPSLFATIPAGQLAAAGYLRAVATLADGSAIEDVRVLADEGLVEEVEVNLVELYAVVTDREGRPVKGLESKDFTAKLDGKRQTLERVSFASDVPLMLGLLIDTSGSMDIQLPEAKQAAGQFLSSVLGKIDRAFVVDFSDRPRLRHRPSGNVFDLIGSFRGMQAAGSTALYDAVLFSLLEFATSPGRRALVLLTDGSDTQSRFGPNRVVQNARRLGVPVYLIVLGGKRAVSGTASLEIAAVTKETGGRLFFPETAADLSSVYKQIQEELRSQYLLTFYTDKVLPPDTRKAVDLEVNRSGLDARLVVKP
jgi:Ca-activated chloride channel homolog